MGVARMHVSNGLSKCIKVRKNQGTTYLCSKRIRIKDRKTFFVFELYKISCLLFCVFLPAFVVMVGGPTILQYYYYNRSPGLGLGPALLPATYQTHLNLTRG